MNGTLRIPDALHVQGHTALVVHDSPADFRMIADYLQECGIEVLDAHGGEEALEKARRAHPDLILLDAIAPGMDGLETCRRLKADDALREIPVILVVAPTETESRVRGFQLGAADYLTKPVRREEALSRVATQLRIRDLSRELQETKRLVARRVEERTAELARENRGLLADLTERMHAEEAYKESEELYRVTLENILDPVFITDDNGKFTFICANVHHILGYSTDELLALGNISRIVGEGLFDLSELKTHGQIQNIEKVMVDRNGRERSFLVTVKRVSIRRGTVLYACHDITERKQAEEALRRSLQETARGQQLLLALGEAAQAVERARTPSEVYQTVGDGIAGLGYHAVIYTPADNPDYLAPSYWTFGPTQLGQAQELLGFSLEDARLAVTPGGLCSRALSGEQPLYFDDIAEFVVDSFPDLPRPLAERMATLVGPGQAICAPLSVGGKLQGLLMVFGIDLQKADLMAVTAFANQATIALENARHLEAATKHKKDLQRLSTQLLDAQEAERKRISLELHDELGQALTVIGMNLEELEGALPPDVAPQLRERLSEATRLADETLEQVREMALGLRPSLLDDLGLVPALRWYTNQLAQRLTIEISFEAAGCGDRLPVQVETALYRIVQEALTNIVRHAQASRAHVRLECGASAIIAIVEDDGQGFDVETVASRSGVGLLGIRERAALLGGSLSIDSRSGRGTRLTLEIPRSEGA